MTMCCVYMWIWRLMCKNRKGFMCVCVSNHIITPTTRRRAALSDACADIRPWWKIHAGANSLKCTYSQTHVLQHICIYVWMYVFGGSCCIFMPLSSHNASNMRQCCVAADFASDVKCLCDLTDTSQREISRTSTVWACDVMMAWCYCPLSAGGSFFSWRLYLT